MCVSTWETTLESLQLFKYPVKAMPGSPSLLHMLSHTRRLHAPGFPHLMQRVGAEKAADELQAPAMGNTKQSHSFRLIYHVAVGLTEELLPADTKPYIVLINIIKFFYRRSLSFCIGVRKPSEKICHQHLNPLILMSLEGMKDQILLLATLMSIWNDSW